MSTASIAPQRRGPSPAPVGARRERKLRSIVLRLNGVLARAMQTPWSRQFITRNTARLGRCAKNLPPFRKANT